MSLFSLIAALFLEQFRPLPNRLLLEPVGRYADFLESRLNAMRAAPSARAMRRA